MKVIMSILLTLGFVSAQAAPIRFDFVFEDPNSGARAAGYIVFEENLLANPTNEVLNNENKGLGEIEGVYEIPGPVVLDLAFTVTGSEFSDGDYGLDDYFETVFRTNGGLLNLITELVGQATSGEPWGTSDDEGIAGDFNLFPVFGDLKSSSSNYYSDLSIRGPINNTPSGCWWFTLCAGPNDRMVLVSMAGTPLSTLPVPINNEWSLLLLIISSLLVGVFVMRKS